jgi:hypothetical protein
MIGLGVVISSSIHIYHDARQLQGFLQDARTIKSEGLKIDQLPRAYETINNISISSDKLKDDFQPFLPIFRAFKWAPILGHYSSQVEPALDYITSLSKACVVIGQTTRPLWPDRSQFEMGVSFQKKATNLLEEKISDIDLAESLLEKAVIAQSQIDAKLIPQKYQDDFNKINTYLPYAIIALKTTHDAPRLFELAQETEGIIDRGVNSDNLPRVIEIIKFASGYIDHIKVEVGSLQLENTNKNDSSKIEQNLSLLKLGLDYLSDLTKATEIIGEVAMSISNKFPDAENGFSQKIISGINGNRERLMLAEDMIKNARNTRAKIDPNQIPSILQSYYDKTNIIQSKLEQGIQLIKIIPLLLGSEKSQSYLVMVQNRDELRATGGFATAFGVIRLNSGKITRLEIQTSDELNYEREIFRPPQPLGFLLETNYLMVRDANWSPDFPTSASLIQKIYYSSKGIPTDGVVAFDQGLLVRLLGFLGPISLGEGEPTLTSDNIQEEMIRFKQQAIIQSGVGERKEFLSTLAPVLIQKILDIHDLNKQIELGELLMELMQSGHLFVYMNNKTVQQMMHEAGMDGAINPEDGDYLAVVDSNLGFGKIDLYIQRKLEYQVNLKNPETPHAVIHLGYLHNHAGNEPCMQGASNFPESSDYYFVRCYWDYWRVLTAGNTSLVKADFEPVPLDYFQDGYKSWKNEITTNPGVNGTTEFAGLTVVPQEQKRDVVLETKPPASVVKKLEDGQLLYTLRVQKQPGIDNIPFTIKINAPSGYKMISPSEGWSYDAGQNLYTWKDDLTKTTDFQIIFGKQ